VTATAGDIFHQQQMETTQQPDDITTPINSSDTVITQQLMYDHIVPTTPTTADEVNLSSISPSHKLA
jgi:hypothetical protein